MLERNRLNGFHYGDEENMTLDSQNMRYDKVEIKSFTLSANISIFN